MSTQKTKFRATVEVKLTTDKPDEAESMINDWLAGESQPDSDDDWSVTKVGLEADLIAQAVRVVARTLCTKYDASDIEDHVGEANAAVAGLQVAGLL